MADFHRILLGDNNTYLIRGNDGYVMIDAGNAFTMPLFKRAIARRGISPEEIKLVVVSHGHFDHVGILAQVKKLTGCSVAIHEDEAHLLASGKTIIPPGTTPFGKSLGFLGERFKKTWILGFAPVEPDIVISDEMSLKPFGVAGSIIPTPGHSSGSLTVLLDSGEAFIGDLALNYIPFGGGVVPPFYDDRETVEASWRKLIERGARRVYPGHLGSLDVASLERKMTHVAPAILSSRQAVQ